MSISESRTIFPCRIEGLGEVWLVNDSHDGNLKNCSIACENRIYGNLSLFALEKQLTVPRYRPRRRKSDGLRIPSRHPQHTVRATERNRICYGLMPKLPDRPASPGTQKISPCP